MTRVREFWRRIETLHAVTYFADESIAAAKTAGLRGFWMGYFGFRAAPLGAVGAGVVEATFANFAPGMVRRAIPDAWAYAAPEQLVVIRASAAADALRRLAPHTPELAARVNHMLDEVVSAATPIGRPLFAANREIEPLDDPVAQMWQHCTTLREHRGDGHVMAVASAGLDGCQAHHLHIASSGVAAEVFRDNRGWTAEAWSDAAAQLQASGLVDDGALTESGRRLHIEIERTTDSLADVPLASSHSDAEIDELIGLLTPAATVIAASGVVPFPNPMGLSRLEPA